MCYLGNAFNSRFVSELAAFQTQTLHSQTRKNVHHWKHPMPWHLIARYQTCFMEAHQSTNSIYVSKTTQATKAKSRTHKEF